MRRSVIAIIALAIASPAFAAPKTIVGKWKMLGQQCTVTAGAIEIGPKSLGSDEYVCRFKNVSRSGYTVTWNGTCQDPYSGSQRTRVVATEKSGRLYLSYNGRRDANGPYERCAR